MTSAFDRLTPALQYHIANTLGFKSLRPVQDLSIQAILDDANCVILAPTAGGKTEAAFFPLLSQMDQHDWSGPSVIYLSPIKALLNNQEHRLETLSAMLSRKVFKWHGDVKASQKAQFIDAPSDILMTTPESLEVMLMSPKVPARRIFSGLKAVVIDEVHAFAGDDRGSHLISLLERLTRYCGNDVQRIGLSATVGNPGDILQWLQGTSQRRSVLVDPPKPAKEPKVHLDWVGNIENAAKVIAALYQDGKRLVFVDSRRRVEMLAEQLREQGVETFLTHSSLSADERHQAEEAFESGQRCVIVATSTMELGIDVGDLDAVFQIDHPPSVASFLQRMGRTGRRANTVPNCTILCTKEESLALSAALLRLWDRGYVEPVEPFDNAYHVLAQQLMALSVQEFGVGTSDWWSWVSGTSAYSDISAKERQSLVQHMIEEDILHKADERLFLGGYGEKHYGRKNFAPLYAVFEAPPQITVFCGKDEIGQLDTSFVQSLPETPCIVLGGQAWILENIDWQRGRCYAKRAPKGKHASWNGPGRLLSREFAESVRDIYQTDNSDPWWSERAERELKDLRDQHAFCLSDDRPFVETSGRVTWFTFLGGKANNLLARLLEERLGNSVSPGNLEITFRYEAANSMAGIYAATRELLTPGNISDDDMMRHADGCARAPMSKFQKCLPESLELKFLAKKLLARP